MKEIYNTLNRLQKILARMFEIEDKIAEIPKALEDKQAVLERTKVAYLELNEKNEKAKEELKEIRQKLDEAEALREKCEVMMESITQAREFETLTKEIDEAKAKEQNYRKYLLAKEKYLNDLNDRIQIQEEIMSHEEEEVNQETERKDSLIAENQAELERIKAEKDEVASGLDEELLFKFERIIRNKHGLGIVPIHGRVCQGCQMMLPAQFVNDVRKEEEIYFCPYCSRMLYFEDEIAAETSEEVFNNEVEEEVEEETSLSSLIDDGEFADF